MFGLKKTQQIESTSEAETNWMNFFMTILSATIDYEDSPQIVQPKIERAALLADLALDQYEKRWAKRSK